MLKKILIAGIIIFSFVIFGVLSSRMMQPAKKSLLENSTSRPSPAESSEVLIPKSAFPGLMMLEGSFTELNNDRFIQTPRKFADFHVTDINFDSIKGCSYIKSDGEVIFTEDQPKEDAKSEIAGQVCRFKISPDLPSYDFYFAKEIKDSTHQSSYITKIEIREESEENIFQTIDLLEHEVLPINNDNRLYPGADFKLMDVNFDNYRDIIINPENKKVYREIMDGKFSINSAKSFFFLFDSQAKRFYFKDFGQEIVRNLDMDRYGNLTSTIFCGQNGKCYHRSFFKFDDSKKLIKTGYINSWVDEMGKQRRESWKLNGQTYKLEDES